MTASPDMTSFRRLLSSWFSGKGYITSRKHGTSARYNDPEDHWDRRISNTGHRPGTMTPRMIYCPRVPASLVMSRLSLLPASRNLPTKSLKSAKTISIGERL